MEMTAAAAWLTDVFSPVDLGILSLMHALVVVDRAGIRMAAGRYHNEVVADGARHTGKAAGIGSRRRRGDGHRPGRDTCYGHITERFGIGFIQMLKDLVARPRPFETLAVYRAWWQSIGSPPEDGYSFPSGHVTAAAAAMSALCFMRGRRRVLPAVCVVLVMAFARCYLMAHFPSDVLAAALIGVLSGYAAYLVTMQIFGFLYTRKKGDRLAAFLLNRSLPLPEFLTYKGKH